MRAASDCVDEMTSHARGTYQWCELTVWESIRLNGESGVSRDP